VDKGKKKPGFSPNYLAKAKDEFVICNPRAKARGNSSKDL